MVCTNIYSREYEEYMALGFCVYKVNMGLALMIL